MTDPKILAKFGTTEAGFQKLFTAVRPANYKELDTDDKKECEFWIEQRARFENMINGWLEEHITFSLNNYRHSAAVDLGWDATPITPCTVPLMLYAQGRINVGNAVTTLKSVPDGENYIKTTKDGKQTVDLPKFFDSNVNLIRSVIGRRAAAQSNKFSNLWPFFSYESRPGGGAGLNDAEANLIADLSSSVMDTMADQWGYRHTQDQMIREMFLHTHAAAFVRAPWEVEYDYRFRGGDWKNGEPENYIAREGVCFVVPHPNRVFWDRAYPLSALNSDTGPCHCGFWDVKRFGDISQCPEYFNRDRITYGRTASLLTAFSEYFAQFYSQTIIAPVQTTGATQPSDLSMHNDRQANMGVYSPDANTSAVFTAELFVKVIPKDWGVGTYPSPIWMALKTAGDRTVIHCKILPSRPGFVFSYNARDNRLLSPSMAHDLMSLQDQLTNLFTQFLETLKQDMFSVVLLNTDIVPDDEAGKAAFDNFIAQMSSERWYADPAALLVSFQKLKELGIDATSDNLLSVKRMPPNTQLNVCIDAISKVIAMADRLMAMSPHEQGQPAQHELSATETNVMSQTTDSVYNFISSGIDEGREAWKRICYESWCIEGSSEIQAPVYKRYRQEDIERLGFQILGSPDTTPLVVKGPRWRIPHELVFSSRDGGERLSNTAAAQVVFEGLGRLGAFPPEIQMELWNAVGKTGLFRMINQAMQLAGVSNEAMLELKPGASDQWEFQDQKAVIDQMAGLIEDLSKKVADLEQAQMQQEAAMSKSPPQP